MKLFDKTLKFSVPTAIIAIGVVVGGPIALGQTTTSSTTLPFASTTKLRKPVPTTTNDQMIQEACQRQKARTAKALATGKPEVFGSEEPFVFDPKAPPC